MTPEEILEKVKERLESDIDNLLKIRGECFVVGLYANRILYEIKMMEGYKNET